jgi:hypothetical protein
MSQEHVAIGLGAIAIVAIVILVLIVGTQAQQLEARDLTVEYYREANEAEQRTIDALQAQINRKRARKPAPVTPACPGLITMGER